MARFNRIISDTVLARGVVLVGSQLDDLDQNTFAAINGDAGGLWEPTALINIGGAGMMATGPWEVEVTGARTSDFEFGEGGALDAFQMPVGHPGRTVDVLTCFTENFTVVPEDTGSLNFPWFVSTSSGGITTLATAKGVRFAVPLNVYEGGTLTDVVFEMKVLENHGPPQFLPRMRVIAHDFAGNIIKLRPASSDTDEDGFVIWNPTPANAASWYNGGAIKSFTYTCTQNNTIDLSKYFYYVEVIDESGANSYVTLGGQWNCVTSTFTNIPVIDGRT